MFWAETLPDISNYKNIKVPTSYMAVNSKYNFEGGYENDTHGGMLHVASHHFSPGKKQWTWGNGDFGRAWDRNLTDKDDKGVFCPYIELMAGVYTENQPDFTWLMPYEEKQFTQYFMPYRELGMVKQASKDFILSIAPSGAESAITFKVLATSKQEVRIKLCSKQGVEYDNKVVTLSPEDTKTNDQLYLTGLHLEQYRHATWSALDYYEEALRRDPNNVRCLNQTGLWYLRRGRFDKAEPYLRRAVKIWQKRNPNPYDGEAIFNLALCLKYLSRPEEAYELFWKSTWNKGWADAGYFEAACISVSQGRYDDALDELNRCLIFNCCNHKARAPYYLGCLYYDKRQYDVAIENWELSARLDPQFPTVWRNLALARFNKQGRQQEALEHMEKAFALDTTDARTLMELDQLYRRMQKSHTFRLENLQKYPELIQERDDLVLEEITLLNQVGRYSEAMKKLDTHQFHPWEGGEGKLPAQYQTARVELAKHALKNNDPKQAEALLKQCFDYPNHLGEGKLYGAQENDFFYYLGCAYEQQGNMEKARECWEEATKGPQEPAAAIYYNDAKPEKIYYQGLALQKLGRKDEANGRFYKLVNYGKQHIFDSMVMDYFAVSLPDLLI